MSSHDKDPLDKDDTSASDSSSDKELSEAKLEDLRIESIKDDSDESKPQTPKEAVTSKCDPLDEPTAGPSGLGASHLESSDLESKIPGLAAPQKEKIEQGIDENIGTRMEEGESDSSIKDVDPTIYENYPPRREERESHPSKDVDPTIYENYPPRREEGESHPSKDVDPTIYENYPPRRVEGESQHGKDVDPTIYENYPLRIEEGESLASEMDVEPTLLETYVPSNSDTSSTGLPFCQSSTGVTPLSQQVRPGGLQRQIGLLNRPQNILDRYNAPPSCVSSLKRSAYKTDSQNTSADISDLQSEIVDIPADAVNPEGQELQVKDASDSTSTTTSTSTGETTSESMEEDKVSGDKRMERGEETNVPGETRRRASASRLGQDCGEGEPSPSKRRRPARGLSSSSETEERIVDRLRSRSKGKMVASQSCPALQSTSQYPEPESSCSGDLHRRESPDIKSLSGAEISKPAGIRKEHQVRGRLRDLKYSTISSSDSSIAEEARTSPSRAQDPVMETKDPIPEKMETSPEKGGELADATSEAKRSTESSHEAVGSETEETSGSTEESERSVGKYKRDPKLGSSPPSDEISDSPPKATTKRTKKKSRSDEMSELTQGTSQDTGSTVPRSVSLGDLQQSDSTTISEEGDNTI